MLSWPRYTLGVRSAWVSHTSIRNCADSASLQLSVGERQLSGEGVGWWEPVVVVVVVS